MDSALDCARLVNKASYMSIFATFIRYIGLFIFLYSTVEAIPESDFERWARRSIKRLNSAGEIVQTSYGPIQYIWKGDRNKPVILSIHGSFGGWDQSLLISQNLLDEGFSILAISRPGYLGSSEASCLSHEDQAAALVEVLDALNISKVAVIGFSAGAPTAFQVANLFPDRVWALVLESIGMQDENAIAFLYLAGIIIFEDLMGDSKTLDFMTYLIAQKAINDFYSTAKQILANDNNLSKRPLRRRINHVVENPKQANFLKKLIFSASPLSPRFNGIVNDSVLANIGNWPEDPSFYQNLTTPTLIIQGIHDTDGNLATARYVQRQLVNSRLLPVKGCGHFIWLGRFTQSWEKKMTAFLKERIPY